MKAAHRVHISTKKAVAAAPRMSVIFTPTNPAGELKTSDDTKKRLLTKLKPIDLGIKPEGISKHGTNGISVTTQKVKTDKINKAGLEMKVIGKLNLRVAVYGVPSEFVGGDVVATSKFGPKCKHFNHWVLEVTLKIRADLVGKSMLRVGIMYNQRSHKSQKFGHLQKDCRSETVCGHCADKHNTRNCQNLSSASKCVNCAAANVRDHAHEARSPKCSMFARKTFDLISNIDYGE